MEESGRSLEGTQGKAGRGEEVNLVRGRYDRRS